MTKLSNDSGISNAAPFSAGSTHRQSTVHIDEVTRTAQASKQWLLEGADEDGSHPITPHNVITVLIGGQEGFAAIAADLKSARASVDLVCWGFDPAMELVRSGSTWPRGETYGEVLRRIATRVENPVKVRLLLWYSAIGSKLLKNLPGLTDWLIPPMSYAPPTLHLIGTLNADGQRWTPPPPPQMTVSERRALHCQEWWKWALDPKNRSRIEIVRRHADSDAIKSLIAHELHQPFSAPFPVISERSLLENHGSHHQKTVLIDYHHEEGAHAVGYVMGLNSLTGYWDTRRHQFNDPLRERQQDAPPGTAVSEVVGRVTNAGGDTTDVRVDPLHDYACRIRGQALACIHRNFVSAWTRIRESSNPDEKKLPSRLAEVTRYAQGSRLQVVRTQPEDHDQTIRALYFHATGQARNYLYMENQYFQYTEWAEHLMSCRKKYLAAYQDVAGGAGPSAPTTLHVFIVIPKPESAEMVPRTFDTLKVLGRSDLMHELNSNSLPQGQWVEMMQERDQLKDWNDRHPGGPESRREFERRHREQLDIDRKTYLTDQKTNDKYHGRPYQSDVGRSAALIDEPTFNELENLKINILVAMLESHDDGSSGLDGKTAKDKYRQIYIHSKLLLIDDSFITLGSANLNMRSMSADSEINVATDDPNQCRNLRIDVWGQHTAGLSTGYSGSPKNISRTFKEWKTIMKNNDSAKISGRPLSGFISTFHDKKMSSIRYA